MATKISAKNSNEGDLCFEAELFKAADKLRDSMEEPSDDKYVALWRQQQVESAKLDAATEVNLEALGYGALAA